MTHISKGAALEMIGGRLLEEVTAPGTMNEKHARAFLSHGGPITDEKALAKLFDFIEQATAAAVGRWLQEQGILKYRKIYGALFTGRWKEERKKVSARLRSSPKRNKAWQAKLAKIRKASEQKRKVA